MNFSVVIPTRGDQDLTPIIASYDGVADEVIIWDNGAKRVYAARSGNDVAPRAGVYPGVDCEVADLSVYGRYAAIEYAMNDLIVTQDDDCVVSDPQAIVDKWKEVWATYSPGYHHNSIQWADHHVVCNMPPEFRHGFYTDHALVGFGACFHRDAPQRAFDRWWSYDFPTMSGEDGYFNRTCDIVFTALTPRVLVDVPHENLPWAYHYDRMYRQPELLAERARMRELVSQIA